MTVRSEIFNLIDLGPLPSEAGSVTDVARRQTLIQSIAPPLTLAEATALAGVLGPDICFGLAWTVVHLIESAPGWSVERVPSGSSPLLDTLRGRASNAQARAPPGAGAHPLFTTDIASLQPSQGRTTFPWPGSHTGRRHNTGDR